MSDRHQRSESENTVSPRHHIRLPGFITEEQIGLGDLVKKASYSVGVKACAGCEQRSTTLNRWMSFGPKK